MYSFGVQRKAGEKRLKEVNEAKEASNSSSSSSSEGEYGGRREVSRKEGGHVNNNAMRAQGGCDGSTAGTVESQ